MQTCPHGFPIVHVKHCTECEHQRELDEVRAERDAYRSLCKATGITSDRLLDVAGTAQIWDGLVDLMLRAVDTGEPQANHIAVRDGDTLVWLWASTSSQSPEARCAELRADIARLTAELNGQTKRLAAVVCERETWAGDANAAIARLTAEKDDARLEAQRAHSAVYALTQERCETELALDETGEPCDDGEYALSMASRIRTLAVDRDIAVQNDRTMAAEAARLTAERDALVRRVADLTADLEIQRDMSDGAVRVSARLTASLTAAEAERDAAVSERDSLAARVKAMLAECEKQARIDDATTKAKANTAAAIALHGKGE